MAVKLNTHIRGRVAAPVLAMCALAAGLWPSSAAAQNVALQIQYCNDDTAETDVRIDACTVVIQSGRTPDSSSFYLTRGYLLMQSGRQDAGRADFDHVLMQFSDDPEMHFAVAVTIQASGHPSLALPYYDDIIARFPEQSAAAYNNKAWLLATSPDASVRNGNEAVIAALAAVELEDSWTYRDTLAAAYAEQGDFARAVEEQETALEMVEENMPAAVVEAAQARLDLFRQGQPYRE